MNNREFPARFNVFMRSGLRPYSPAAFTFAIICVAVATLVRWSIGLVTPNVAPFITYYPAIMIVTLAAGWAVGALALLGSVIEAWLLFMPSYDQRVSFTFDHAVSFVLFIITAMIILWVGEQFRRVVRRLDEEEYYRQIVIDELGHRVKNKFATVYAILRHELRDQPKVWESVSGRLRALSATDDFLVRSKRESIDLNRILGQELAPYDASRISIKGGPVELPSKLAVVLSLILHELSTNAAKYGALSSSLGKLDISWRPNGDDITLDWVETGGPLVDAPTKRSFGTNLIERSLDTFGGKAKITFARTGVVCCMQFPKPVAVTPPKSEAGGLAA